MNRQVLSGVLALLIGTLACKPVIAISWNEFLIVGVLFTMLLGPPLYKFIRRAEDFFRQKVKKK